MQAPVVDGYSFPHLTKRLDIAGQQITKYLLDLLLRRGYAFNYAADVDNLRQMKECLCYVACNYQQEMKVVMSTAALHGQMLLFKSGRLMAFSGQS